MATKTYCDCCGEEMTTTFPMNRISFPCHLNPLSPFYKEGMVYIDSKDNPVSGRTDQYDVCNSCSNSLYNLSVQAFVAIRKERVRQSDSDTPAVIDRHEVNATTNQVRSWHETRKKIKELYSLHVYKELVDSVIIEVLRKKLKTELERHKLDPELVKKNRDHVCCVLKTPINHGRPIEESWEFVDMQDIASAIIYELFIKR